MEFLRNFTGLAIFMLALAGVGMTTPLAAPAENEVAAVSTDEPAAYLMSHEQMMHWLATTDAELTFVGEPLNPLSPRSAQVTTVTYCSTRIENVCGGACTVYTGGTTCLNAPDTNCLAATNNVGFCDRGGCTHSCHDLASCGTRLDNGFCYTPGTQSIAVSSA